MCPPEAVRARWSEGEPMPSRGSATLLRSTVVLFVAILVAACSSEPQSLARESVAPSAPAPATAAPASATPTDAPTDAPTEPVATPEPTPVATPGVPPKPAAVTFRKVGEKTSGGKTKVTYRVTWNSPAGVATSFLVYGVNRCLRESRQNNNTACVAKGMAIPKGTLELIAQAPGALRTIDVTWTVPEAGPGPYYAVLVRAANDAGKSIFTIAWSDKVCWGCTY
jgi:hypothetical protein